MKHPEIILTLDAGGTNFVFSAMQDYREMIDPVRIPAYPHDLEKCLEAVFNGFERVGAQLPAPADAISFAFPGPADYDRGIIGNLPNFKAFNDAVPLGPMLEEHFRIPVYINNDGNLFAYGEALSGLLPEVNRRIREEGGIKQFRNLVGVTLGTGFGGGIVMDNLMVVGDNSCGAEVHNTLNKFNPEWNAEESVSTRAICRSYSDLSGEALPAGWMPEEIAQVARGERQGDRTAALEAFEAFGEALGSSLANFLCLIDGIAVLGGGLTEAWPLFAPAMFRELNRPYTTPSGDCYDRLSFRVFDLEDDAVFREFALGKIRTLTLPGSTRVLEFDDMPRVGVGRSKPGASKSIALGAYAFALRKLNP